MTTKLMLIFQTFVPQYRSVHSPSGIFKFHFGDKWIGAYPKLPPHTYLFGKPIEIMFHNWCILSIKQNSEFDKII